MNTKKNTKYWKIKSWQGFKNFVDPDLITAKKHDGVFEITLKNWRLIDPLLYTMIEMSHTIFRGVQNSDYMLEPSIFRSYAFKNMKTLAERNQYIHQCFNHFRESVRGRRGPFSKPLDTYNNYELWSLGRHFGVNNTMLDWSLSPYVCLFFAFSNWETDGIRSLYCLKYNIIEKFRRKSKIEIDDDITLKKYPDYDSLIFYRPQSDENFRMINQQGLFTVSRSAHTIEDWVSYNYNTVKLSIEREYNLRKNQKLRWELDSKWILKKINVVTKNWQERQQILKYLNRMNINYATLFPDVEGASLYSNMQGDIIHY